MTNFPLCDGNKIYINYLNDVSSEEYPCLRFRQLLFFFYQIQKNK